MLFENSRVIVCAAVSCCCVGRLTGTGKKITVGAIHFFKNVV